MKKIVSILLALLFCVSLTACAVKLPEGVTEDDIMSNSQIVIDCLNAKDYEKLGEMYTPVMATALENNKLAEVWEPIYEQLGTFEKIEKHTLQVKNESTTVTILAKYTTKSIVYTFTFTPEYKLDGLFMK